MPLIPPHLPLPTPPFVVLDTNVVLDLLVFADVRTRRLAEALDRRQLGWLATSAMLDELADVLTRPFITRWCADAQAVQARVRAQCQLVEPPPARGATAPRCADPDDQKFIELAWHWPAAWLFSRDRAVLDLARPAYGHGLVITTPAAWSGLPGAQNEEGAAEAAP